MERIFGITTSFLLFLFLAFINIVKVQSETLDITKLGAAADGTADISQALATAWGQACNSTTATTIVIPKGTFLLNKATLEGPCKAPIEIQVQGIVKAPSNPMQITNGKDTEWVTIQYVNQLTISGGGTFDGQGGALAWNQNECHKSSLCNVLPNNFGFNFLNDSVIRDITSLNSKLFHLLLFGSNNVTFSNVKVSAPGDSPNTDGIHIGHCSGITIIDSNIQTGDDCISIGDGSKQINITRVNCGPGHGISIGSLGKYDNEQPVDGIFVKNCTIAGTLNGIRVKTWPSASTGLATNMHFEDIIMQNVSNPIIIDQQYCPHNQCHLGGSNVKISKVSIKGIKGTSATPVAVSLLCSSSIPCEAVEIGDINLEYIGTVPGKISSTCSNVKPTFTGTQIPPVCTGPAQAS